MSELGISSIFLIAVGLSADCFAVTLSGSISVGSITLLQKVRTAFTFGLFQGLMPVLGWLAGRTIVDLIADYDHWIAFTLLAFIGVKMIWESLRNNKEKQTSIDITRGLMLLTLAIATSIDALAVGLTFAFLEINMILASSLIGIVSFLVTILGFLLGRKAGNMIGKRAETIGGVILISIGLRILLTHVL